MVGTVKSHACLLLLLGAVRLFAVDVTIDGSDEQQTIDGFGTSVMNWMASTFADAEVRRIYARDLGCSIVRGELHPMAITKDKCMDKNPTTFGSDIAANAALMDFDGQSRVYITGRFMKAVYNDRLDEMKIMLSIWTPPDWMKANTRFGDPGCQSYGGHLVRTDENRTNFARYVAAWIYGFQQEYSIPVHALSVQNELDWAHANASYTTSCQYFATDYPTGSSRADNGPPLGVNDYNPAVRYVYDELKANDLDIKLLGPEKSHIFQSADRLGQQMSYIRDMADDGTMEIMDGFCHHGYAHTPGNRDIVSAYRTAIAKYNKPSWQTEAGHLPHTYQGGFDLARTLQDELVAGNTSAWLNWNFTSSSSNDEHALMINTTEKTPKYYAFKHFSRYIRPGAVRLGCSPDDGNGLSVSAYRHDINGTLTIVVVNAGTATSATITLPDVPGNLSTFAAYTSQEGAMWAESQVTASAGKLSLSVPSSGIMTLYGQGAVRARRRAFRDRDVFSRIAAPGPQLQLGAGGLAGVRLKTPSGIYDLCGRRSIDARGPRASR